MELESYWPGSWKRISPRISPCGRDTNELTACSPGSAGIPRARANCGAGMSIIAQLFVAFFILCAAGAVIAFLIPSRWNPIVLGAVGSLCAFIILLASGMLLLSDAAFNTELWSVLTLGTLTLGADRLSAIFLFAAGLVFLPVSMFSGIYLDKYLTHYSLRYFSVLYHALFASIVLVLIADDAISFLAAWETVSITSYLLVNYEYERDQSSHAGFVMVAMSEAGTIAVALAFMLLAGTAGTLGFAELRTVAPSLAADIGWAVFLLSFFGFAVKAGLVPVNSWLPLAHPVAPTNVSALLSAVIVNLGIYGIIRVNLDLSPATSSGPGLIVLVIGSLSALVGILYATIQGEMRSQHDREHGNHRSRYRRRHGLRCDRTPSRRGHRSHCGALPSRQSLRVQGASLRRDRCRGSWRRHPRS
jgi:hydrogenase-4 component B